MNTSLVKNLYKISMSTIQNSEVIVNDQEAYAYRLLLLVLDGDTPERRVKLARELKKFFQELQIIERS